MKPLIIPPAAQRDPNSVQMLSAWIAEKGLHCSLNVGMWTAAGTPEARAWGILLADTARHVANAMASSLGVAQPDALAAVLEAMHSELAQPSSRVRGSFLPGHT